MLGEIWQRIGTAQSGCIPCFPCTLHTVLIR